MAIQENTSKLADRRYTVYGEFNQETKRGIAIKLKSNIGQRSPEAQFAFQGKDQDGKSGSIRIEYMDLRNFLRTLKVVAENPEQWMDRKATFLIRGYNPATKKGDLDTFLYAGRTKEGICYIGMKNPTAFAKAIKAEFKSKFGMLSVDAEGTPFSNAETSSNIAWTWADEIERILIAEYDRTWEFRGSQYYQNQRNGNGGGNNGYNNNNNGGYNQRPAQQQQAQVSYDNFDDDIGF